MESDAAACGLYDCDSARLRVAIGVVGVLRLREGEAETCKGVDGIAGEEVNRLLDEILRPSAEI